MNWKVYTDMNEKIHPDEALVEKLLSRAGKAGGNKSARRIPKAAAIVAAVLAISLAAPAALAASPTTYQWMYGLSPQMAQFFVPVNESCEDNGIRMEILSAHVDGNTVELYISLRDLTGDRVDETIDLFDSYAINTPFDSSGTCSLAEYDRETGTAVFLVSLTENSSRDLSGKKVTFAANRLLSHKAYQSDVRIGAIPDPFSHETMLLSFDAPPHSDYTLFSVSEYPVANRSVTVLTPSGSGLALSEQYACSITGIGWIDGQLHIQIATDQRLNRDAQVWLRLRATNGDIAEPVKKYSFAQDASGEGRIDYEEYIFDIPQDEISDYTLYGDFSIAGLRTEGNWRVTFRLPEAQSSSS